MRINSNIQNNNSINPVLLIIQEVEFFLGSIWTFVNRTQFWVWRLQSICDAGEYIYKKVY